MHSLATWAFTDPYVCSEFTWVVSKMSSSQAVPTFVSREGEKEKGVNQDAGRRVADRGHWSPHLEKEVKKLWWHQIGQILNPKCRGLKYQAFLFLPKFDN